MLRQSVMLFRLAATVFGATFIGSLPAQATPPLENVGTRKQLMVDDHFLASATGVTRKLQAATKENGGQPIRFWTTDNANTRTPLKAWIYASPFYDETRKVFRMWSRVLPNLSAGKALEGTVSHNFMRLGYSESKDGVDFDFVSELQGLHIAGDYSSVVYIDPHETNPAHRYKVGYDGAPKGFPFGACLAHSADGIHWTAYNDGKPVTGRAADFTNCLIWDEAAKTYRLFTRTDYGSGGGVTEVRGLRMMTNANPKANPADWKTVRSWKFDREGPDEANRRQIYTMTDWIYCDIHFGLFAVYEWPNDFSEGQETDHVKRHERDVLNYYLATSRDGDAWDLTWIYAGKPLVERGGDGAWDKDIVMPANWIVTHDDRHWIYYGGANERHGVGGGFQPKRESSIGLATLPLDRFVGLESQDATGVVVTKPFELTAEVLQINADCRGGKVAVEVLNADGTPLPGFTLAESRSLVDKDGLRLHPAWKEHADLSSLVGQAIQLRFHLDQATLYAFQIVAPPSPSTP